MLKRILALVSFTPALSLAASGFLVDQQADGIRISPQSDYAAAAVTISGPQGDQRLEFTANENIVIPVPSIDGLYNYEVVLTPVLNQSQKNALQQERASGGGLSARVGNHEQTFARHFRITGGALVTTQGEEPSSDQDSGVVTEGGAVRATVLATADSVIQGSLCTGIDCSSGESFGFDTLRLKENNLRLHFDDTSNSASFPNNDWRLIANESDNGGANLFALEDSSAGQRIATFTAGAGANALVIDAQGDLGLGTSTPVVELQITDGDTPTIRMEQNGSSGFTPQTFDIATNETNFFIRDVSNGSALSFRIQPGSATADTLIIDNEGQVSIGKPGSIEANATLHVRARNVGTDDAVLVEDVAGNDLLNLQTDGDMTLAGTLAQLSRRDSKEHFSKVNHRAILAALKQLSISTWNYKHQPDDQRHLGPMAEDFHAAYGLGTDPQHIVTSDMAAVALASSQALLVELDNKEERIVELEDRLAQMEQMMTLLLPQRDEEGKQTLASR